MRLYGTCLEGARLRTVDALIHWLTGYDAATLAEALADWRDFETFFAKAPVMTPDRKLIKGVAGGIRVEDIEEPLMQDIRYLGKLFDERARGKKYANIFRS